MRFIVILILLMLLVTSVGGFAVSVYVWQRSEQERWVSSAQIRRMEADTRSHVGRLESELRETRKVLSTLGEESVARLVRQMSVREMEPPAIRAEELDAIETPAVRAWAESVLRGESSGPGRALEVMDQLAPELEAVRDSLEALTNLRRGLYRGKSSIYEDGEVTAEEAPTLEIIREQLSLAEAAIPKAENRERLLAAIQMLAEDVIAQAAMDAVREGSAEEAVELIVSARMAGSMYPATQ